MKQAVFLDRDGTINVEKDYLGNLTDLELIEGSARGIRMLNRSGMPVIVISNQSGVARGFFSINFVEMVHRELSRMLEKRGARIDGWYFCPHHPEAGAPPYRRKCGCRKPGTALLERAAGDMGIDIGHSWFVGDSLSDLQTAWNAGMKGILVLTGHGGKTFKALSENDRERIDHVATDLLDACRWITGRQR